MKLTSIHLINLKSFENCKLDSLSPSINLLVGTNNSGKSTILRSCYIIQPRSGDFGQIEEYLRKNIRKGKGALSIRLEFKTTEVSYLPQVKNDFYNPFVEFLLQNGAFKHLISITNKNVSISNPISSREPKNFIYPFLSQRKVTSYNETFNLDSTVNVNDKLDNLYAKIDRISNVDYPAYDEYRNACIEILGFYVSCSFSQKGKQAGLLISSHDYIPIDEMGEGTINILGIIVDLCIAKNKLFLIEELENDIHPKALKSLLDLIIRKSKENQFIISTHSNIVTKYLASVPESKLFNIEMSLNDKIPTSTVIEIENKPETRIKVLEDLGYDLYDFDLWKAYLILEESSAEKIIRDYLIPEFVPSLVNKLRTIAAQGAYDLSVRFYDFLRLFVYINLTSAYQNRAWVYADGDEAGQKAISELKSRFVDWDTTHFQNFSKKNFEEYYPIRWKERVADVAMKSNKKEKYDLKKSLIEDVLKWIIDNRESAKIEFEQSAAEIISVLRNIESQLI